MSFSKKRARVRKNTRARALSLIRNHATPIERWTENSRESLSLSLSLSRAPFVRKRDDKYAQKERHKKSAGLKEKSPHARIQFYPPLSKRERERDTFSAQTTTRTYPLERMCLCTSSVAPCVKSTYEPCFFIFSHRG
jgi:hypothetical protein